MTTIALILAIIAFIAGLIGTVMPVLPGPVLIYAGMLLYGAMTDFASLDSGFFVMQAIALAIVFSVDYVASAVGTRLFGGSKQAAVGAIIGTVPALVFLGPLGIVIGPFVGAVAIELLRGAKLTAAVRVGFGTLIGTLGGTLFKLCAEVVMIVYFFIKVL
ncbi:MAG: DUF456 domain-containing protein [Bacillota bacterium]|nr:DUF456 domain-containing protein [Bacillota bacterium]